MRIERRGEEEREQKEAAGIERDVGKETESECLVILQFVPKGFVPPPASRSLRKSAHAIASPPPSIAKVKFCTCAKCARAVSALADGPTDGRREVRRVSAPSDSRHALARSLALPPLRVASAVCDCILEFWAGALPRSKEDGGAAAA